MLKIYVMRLRYKRWDEIFYSCNVSLNSFLTQISKYTKFLFFLKVYKFRLSRISRNHDTLMRKKEVAHQSSPVLSPSHTFVLLCSIVMCQVCAFALPRTPTLAEKQPVLLNWQPQLCHINNVSSQCLLQTRSHLKIQFNLPHFLVLD